MDIKTLKDYFSKLVNLPIDDNTIIKLSSGQSARAHAWLISNNIRYDSLNLGGGFTISQLKTAGWAEVPSQDELAPYSSNAKILPQLNEAIGIDIQSISELFPDGLVSDPKSDGELLSIFTARELSYSQSKVDSMQTLTGIFAAKEAILKCSEIKIAFNELEILPNSDGKPCFEGYRLSISHSQEYAIAIAMPEPKMCQELIKAPSGFNSHSSAQSKSRDALHYMVLGAFLAILAFELLRFFN